MNFLNLTIKTNLFLLKKQVFIINIMFFIIQIAINTENQLLKIKINFMNNLIKFFELLSKKRIDFNNLKITFDNSLNGFLINKFLGIKKILAKSKCLNFWINYNI